MSPNSSNGLRSKITSNRWFYSIGLPLWVFVGFMVAQVAVAFGYRGIELLGITAGINETVASTIFGVAVYALTILIIFGIPWLVGKRKTTLKDIGLQRLPTWLDFAWVAAGIFSYFILTMILTAVSRVALPFVNFDQAQDTGFSGILSQFEYILAFLSLVVLAPAAEETLFRGYLFGKLGKHFSTWISILTTSLLFALVHFQWNVSIDVFALSIVLCLLRVATGSIWASILLHMVKNGLAFYFLFINTSLLSTLG